MARSLPWALWPHFLWHGVRTHASVSTCRLRGTGCGVQCTGGAAAGNALDSSRGCFVCCKSTTAAHVHSGVSQRTRKHPDVGKHTPTHPYTSRHTPMPPMPIARHPKSPWVLQHRAHTSRTFRPDSTRPCSKRGMSAGRPVVFNPPLPPRLSQRRVTCPIRGARADLSPRRRP
ncbi:hypothetical protein C2E23DRAFT_462757 [Lenzites betulinus]|nr:hypothetical protein C2E23DRAFT_462757 [Lenzites betulinus]